MESDGHSFVVELNGCPTVYVRTRTEQGMKGTGREFIFLALFPDRRVVT